MREIQFSWNSIAGDLKGSFILEQNENENDFSLIFLTP